MKDTEIAVKAKRNDNALATKATFFFQDYAW